MADANLRIISGGLIFAAGLCLATSFSTSSLHAATPTAVKTALPLARFSQPKQSLQTPQLFSAASSLTTETQTHSAHNSCWLAATGLTFSVAGLVVTLFRKPSTTALLAETGVKAEPAPWTAPKLSEALKNDAARRKAEALSTQLPTFWQIREDLSKVPKSEFEKVFASYKGSTGTLLSAAKTEEYYAITWTSPKKQIYELPTGGAAEMDEGLNINYYARKEQCLALGAQLRTFKPRIENYAIYRVFPNGETQYLHPKDGVFPEKVNEGRQKVNHNPRSIGENVEPGSIKFEGKAPKDVATEGAVAMFAETGEKAEKVWTVPTLADALKNAAAVQRAKEIATQLPTFWDIRADLSKVPKDKFADVFASYKGSTGTLLSAATTEEKYVITWTSPKKQIFELPTGGAAEMEAGENVLFFARKEQCLALGAQLRTAFKPRIEDFKIFRVFPNGEAQYLHPKDGVFPEKVTEGRQKANYNPRSIGENVEPGAVKFEGKAPKDVATEGAVAMFAETAEKPAWTVPKLADALKDSAAVQRAQELATQFPTFWDIRADLSKVPKEKFADVFASYKGSTGTLLSAAATEEKYVITWTSPKKQIFELPTGGAAEMEAGENVLFFARKEQCLALGAQLRTAFKPRIEDFKIFRVFPNGEAQYLHPKDGVFPEKVNEGRQKANHNPRSIGENVEPGAVKFEGKAPKDVATEGTVAMFAETGEKTEKPAWTTPSLADALKNTAAVQRAKEIATQFPTFWDIRADLSKVPKDKFADVFASYKGSTGTLLSAATTEEKYVIAWTSPKKQIFELPTGGAAEMEVGENVLFFARKEQCLALGAQLRTAFKPRIEDFKIFRVFPNGEAQYLHPKDGVFPEKVNEGRQKANYNPRSIGENVEPGSVKFEGKAPKDL